MSQLQRRDFLTRSAAFTAAAAAFGGGGRAVAGDPSFMNNVPDPHLKDKELPTFTFALEKSDSAGQLPCSTSFRRRMFSSRPGANCAKAAYCDRRASRSEDESL